MTATRADGFGKSAVPRGAVGRGPRRSLEDWIARLRRRSAELRTARDVALMDDALLRDIGLSRADAEHLARTGRVDRATR